ncbi:unnamed protein product [Rhizopus stolonifer]
MTSTPICLVQQESHLNGPLCYTLAIASRVDKQPTFHRGTSSSNYRLHFLLQSFLSAYQATVTIISRDDLGKGSWKATFGPELALPGRSSYPSGQLSFSTTSFATRIPTLQSTAVGRQCNNEENMSWRSCHTMKSIPK